MTHPLFWRLREAAQLFAFLLVVVPGVCSAQTAAEARSVSIFADKPLVAPHIHADTAARFVTWKKTPVALGEYPEDFFERTRIGTVNLAPGHPVHLDIVANMTHYPSYFELLDARSGALLGKYPVFARDDVDWYFADDGTAYFNRTHLSLCGPRYTTMLALRGSRLAEVAQPLIAIGAESTVEESTPLFASPAGKEIVTTVPTGSKVIVIGLQPERQTMPTMALLVRTPQGLTGWHLPTFSEARGKLGIYQCN
jgi:hypothetical protein